MKANPLVRLLTPEDQPGYRTDLCALWCGGGLLLAWQERSPQGQERIAWGELEGEPTQDCALEPRGYLPGGGHAHSPVLVDTPLGQALLWWSQALEYGQPARCLLSLRAAPGQPWAEPVELLRAHLARDLAAAWQQEGLLVVAACQQQDQHGVTWLRWDLEAQQVQAQGRWDEHGRDLRSRAAVDVGPDGEALVVWEAQEPGRSLLRAAALPPGLAPGQPWTLSASLGAEQQPSVRYRAPGLAWVAFSSDSPQHQRPSLARWTRLIQVDTRRQRQWTAPPPPQQALEAQGEDQSLEFPALALSPDGGVHVVARASHNFKAQSFGGRGWGPLHDLDPSLWGCRGLRLELVQPSPWRLLVLAHGRRGLQLQAVELPQEGPPASEMLAPQRALPLGEVAARPARQAWQVQEQPWLPFWGDIHFHTAHSDGVGTVEEAYLRCRDRYGDDFACLTDHDAFLGRRVTETVWRSMVELSQSFHRPQEGFATLIGIEYTGVRYPGPGHKCVYLPGPQAPLLCRWDDLEAPEAMLARIAEVGGMAIPHHVGWLGGDPEHHDLSVQPCWEVCSAHGQYEARRDEPDAPPIDYREGLPEHREILEGHFLRRRLEAGQVFGFVGGSDGHGLLWHHGISPRADSHRTGLTGVWLPHLSREGILDALRARRTWASSGEKIALGFTLGEHWMGERLQAPPDPSLELRIHYQAAAPLSELAVLAHTAQGTRAVARLQPTDTSGQWRLPLPQASREPAQGFLYVRLTQEDGHVAWASPLTWAAG